MIRRFISRNTERLILFLGGVLISGVASGVVGNITTWPQGTLIAAVVVVTTASLFLFADSRKCIQDLSDKIEANVRNRSYSEQSDMYRDLAKYIDEKGVKKAVLIQYSSVAATNLLGKLMSKGAHITLYVKSPNDVLSKMQAIRIQNAILQLHGCYKVQLVLGLLFMNMMHQHQLGP